MPANRAEVSRDTKAAEILDVAEERFLRQGFDATTIAELARATGVAGNTIYWYFPSKDDLLAAVLARRLEGATLPTARAGPLADLAAEALAALDRLAPLTSTVHERALHSVAVAAVHERFHATVHQAVRSAFESNGLAPADATSAASAVIAMVEGIHLHGGVGDRSERDDLLRWVLARFVR